MPLPFTLSRRLGRSWLRLRLILLCHACTSRCVGNSCSLLSTNLPEPEKAEIGCTLCFPLVDGQRPHPTHSKGTFPKDYGLGWNLWFDLSNKLLVLSVPLNGRPGAEHYTLV